MKKYIIVLTLILFGIISVNCSDEQNVTYLQGGSILNYYAYTSTLRGANHYVNLIEPGTVSLLDELTAINIITMPRDGVIKDLTVRPATNTENGPVIIKIQKNLQDTGLSATIPSGTTSVISTPDTIASTYFSDGDEFSIVIDLSGTSSGVAEFFISMTYE